MVRVEETRFETRYIDIGAWPAPGEQADDVLREGGATQVGADPADLKAALGRCHQYLTKNLALGMDAFKTLGALLLAKLYSDHISHLLVVRSRRSDSANLGCRPCFFRCVNTS